MNTERNSFGQALVGFALIIILFIISARIEYLFNY